MNIKTTALLLTIWLTMPLIGNAQNKIITLEEALKLAKQNYPAIKAAQLNIEKQQKLKSSAFNFGTTSVTTGKEDIKGNKVGAVNNFSIAQSDIDILGMVAKRKYQQAEVDVAKAEYQLTEKNIEFLVRKAYNNLLQKQELLGVYRQIDTVYANFVKSAELRYQTEETSKLALLSAKAKYNELELQIKQLQGENKAATNNLNQYLWIKEPFIVDTKEPLQVLENTTIDGNIDLILMKKQLNCTEKEWKMECAGILPKFSASYTNRKVDGVSGFYSYEAGISIPLFSGAISKSKAAKTQTLIEQENLKTKRIAIESELQQKLIAINNLKELRKYYKEQALPLANEQINASKLAYRLGEINYLEFIQSIESSLKTKIDFINTNAQYRTAVAEILRLIGSKNN